METVVPSKAHPMGSNLFGVHPKLYLLNYCMWLCSFGFSLRTTLAASAWEVGPQVKFGVSLRCFYGSCDQTGTSSLRSINLLLSLKV